MIQDLSVQLTYLCEMAALLESSCTSNISDEAGPQTFDSFSSTIHESRTSASIDSIDVEKRDVSVSTADGRVVQPYKIRNLAY